MFTFQLALEFPKCVPLSPKEEVRKGRETILVAEDHEELRYLARETLVSRGYHVILAANGQEALRLFQENSKKIRLAVLDVVMPIMSGPDAYRQMCAIRPDLLVVFTSGHTGGEVAPLSHQSKGSSVFLQKPYSLQTLGQAVRRTLDGD